MWYDRELRERDAWGEGHFGASRAGGRREHKGVDVCFEEGEAVTSLTDGTVTRLGFPYYDPDDPEKSSLRYVEVTTPAGERIRYFYVEPSVSVGDEIYPEDVLGYAQDIEQFYPNMTPHVHLEVIITNSSGKKTYVDPQPYLNE